MKTIYYNNKNEDDTIYCLIIYDIFDNKRRTKMAKLLEGYGVRVQKSAFEFWISKSVLKSLLENIEKIAEIDDNIRVYNLNKESYRTINKCQENEYIRSDVFIF